MTDTDPEHPERIAGDRHQAPSSDIVPRGQTTAPPTEHSGQPAPAGQNGAGIGDIAPERTSGLRKRWSELKGEFVDTPNS